MIIERHRWMRPRTMTTTTNEWEWEERRWITVRVTGENETNRIGRWQLMATAQLITKKGTKLVGFLSPVLRHWRITDNSNLTPYKVNNKHGPPPPTPPAPNWLIGWTDPPPLPPPTPPRLPVWLIRWTRLLRFLLRHQFGSIHRHKRQSFTSSATSLTHPVHGSPPPPPPLIWLNWLEWRTDLLLLRHQFDSFGSQSLLPPPPVRPAEEGEEGEEGEEEEELSDGQQQRHKFASAAMQNLFLEMVSSDRHSFLETLQMTATPKVVPPDQLSICLSFSGTFFRFFLLDRADWNTARFSMRWEILPVIPVILGGA